MARTALVTPLFWSCLGLSLLCGASAQGLLACNPAAFAEHWFRQGALLAALHLTTLGFIGILILGVLTQFLPMLLGKSLGSTGLVALALACFGLGMALLVSVFAGWRSPGPALVAGTALLGAALGVLALAWSALVHSGPRQRLSRATLASALFYLVFTAGLGTLMAQGLVGDPRVSVDPLALLRLHAHLGLAGFACLTVFGVSYELLPMFNLGRGYPTWPGWCALGLVHAALIFLAVGTLAPFQHPDWGPWSEVLLMLACVAYVSQVAWIQAKAQRPKADSSVWLFRQACVFLLASACAAVVLSFENQTKPGWVKATVYGVLFGFLGGAIFGQLQKIVPLLAWVDRFSSLVGRAKVPNATQLLNHRQAWLALPLHAAALLSGCWGLADSSPVWLRLSGLLGLALFVNQIILVRISRSFGSAVFPPSSPSPPIPPAV